MFHERLCDVFRDEPKRLGEELGDAELARKLVEQDHMLTWAFVPREYC